MPEPESLRCIEPRGAVLTIVPTAHSSVAGCEQSPTEGCHWTLSGRVRDACTWSLPDISSTIDLHDVRVLLGLLIVVQGFETSRYLGGEHPAKQRIATMRAAQLISAVIYIVYIGLCTVLFHDGLSSDVTAIISMTKPVASAAIGRRDW